VNVQPQQSAAATGSEGRSVRGAGSEQPRWARLLRRVLIFLIALLYAVSIPWYRGDAPPERLFGLPDWVTVAILCYAGAAVLNSAAWLLTEIPEVNDDEAGTP